MNTTERASHPSRAQVENLLEFLEKHSNLAKGFPKQPSARDAAHKSWEKVALQLNRIGGCTKSWKQWTKYWADKKSAVKKKAAQRFRARNNTGGGAESLDLSTIEERIVTLMGGESFATGDRHLAINPFTSDPVDDEKTPSLLNSQLVRLIETEQPAEDEQQVSATSIATETPQHPVTMECVPGTSYSSMRPSIVQIIVESSVPTTQSPRITSSPRIPSGICEPANPTAIPSPAGSYPPKPNQTGQRHNLIAETSCRRSKRRQRNTHMLTERFLQIEEQRVDVDRHNSELLENVINLVRERDASTSQALLAIGEGLKALAEALKK